MFMWVIHSFFLQNLNKKGIFGSIFTVSCILCWRRIQIISLTFFCRLQISQSLIISLHLRIASFIRISVLFCWLVCCHSICRLLLLLLYHLRVILLSTASCFVSIKVVQNLLIIRLLLRIIYFLVLSTKWIDTTCIIIVSI